MNQQCQTHTCQSERTNAAAQRPEFQTTQTIRPDVDLYESDTAYIMHFDLPGVAEDQVQVLIEQNVLTLSAEAAAPVVEGGRLVHGDANPRHYERAFKLSDQVDAQGVEAILRHGVLTLTLPKTPAVQPKRVVVQKG